MGEAGTVAEAEVVAVFKGAEGFKEGEGGLTTAGDDSLGFGKNDSVLGISLCFERLDVSCMMLRSTIRY